MATYLLIAFAVCVLAGFLLMWLRVRELERHVLLLTESWAENVPVIARDMRYLHDGLTEARGELNLPQTWSAAGKHSIH